MVGAGRIGVGGSMAGGKGAGGLGEVAEGGRRGNKLFFHTNVPLV